MAKQLSPKEKDDRPAVLVVEDNRDVRAMLARLLDAHGWRVVTIGDGLSALQIIDAERFDGCICDLHLPGPSGEMVLEYARRRCPDIRAILVSGWVTRRARERAEAVGAVIFEKPIEFDALLEELCRDRPTKA